MKTSRFEQRLRKLVETEPFDLVTAEKLSIVEAFQDYTLTKTEENLLMDLYCGMQPN